MPNSNLCPAGGAGPILNCLQNGPGYPPGLKVVDAVTSLGALQIKKSDFYFFSFEISDLDL